MGLFNRKEKVNLEDFCRNFYDNYILNPIVRSVNFGTALPDYVINEIDSLFAHIDKHRLTEELMILRFELFALAWTHKFVSGKIVVAQSAFTKQYLNEKGKNDIWNGMEPYNKMINSATLHWLTSLGKMNLSFNYNMRKDLTVKNIEDAKELGIDIDESIERVNNRLWSENAWKQKIPLGGLTDTFCNQLGLNTNELNKGADFRLAVMFIGFYDGAQQSWDKVKITIKNEMSDLEKSVLDYKKAIRKNHNDGSAYYNLGSAYSNLGLYKEAIEAYKQAIRITPNVDIVYDFLARLYIQLGLYKEAIEACKQAISISPNSSIGAMAYYDLGVAYRSLGLYKEAIEAYKQAIRITPNNISYVAYYDLGVAYRSLGLYKEAIEACKQAIPLASDCPDARFELGFNCLQIGDKSSALNEYKILKELDIDKANELFDLINK